MEMNWVDRRARLEATTPNAWGVLCSDMEAAIKAFDVKYLNPGARGEAKCNRPGDCLRVAIETFANPPVLRMIDICWDRKARRVFSRANDGTEGITIYFGCTENGDAVLVDDHGAYVSNDRASQLLLEPFLFPGEILAPYVRFPISTTGS